MVYSAEVGTTMTLRNGTIKTVNCFSFTGLLCPTGVLVGKQVAFVSHREVVE